MKELNLNQKLAIYRLAKKDIINKEEYFICNALLRNMINLGLEPRCRGLKYIVCRYFTELWEYKKEHDLWDYIPYGWFGNPDKEENQLKRIEVLDEMILKLEQHERI